MTTEKLEEIIDLTFILRESIAGKEETEEAQESKIANTVSLRSK